MLHTERELPRFSVAFSIASNDLVGKGVNLSQSGLGFLTEDEIIPSEGIPFSAEIRGAIFSTRTYQIKGTANLLYSIQSPAHGDLHYNGFEFTELLGESGSILQDLIQDLSRLGSASTEEQKQDIVNLANYTDFPSSDIFEKAVYFCSLAKPQLHSDYKTLSSYLDSSSASSARIALRDTTTSRDMIMMGSNNYLGLTTHPDVIQAGIRSLEKYGAGNGAGSMVGGTLTIHNQLEEELSDFIGKDAAMLFSSGYAANVGTISGLARPHDAVINDQYNHASIFDGCRLSGAKTLLYAHNDLDSLR